MNGLVKPIVPPPLLPCEPLASSSGQSTFTSLRSIPVQNAFSPAAVSTTQLTSGLWRRPRQTSRSSSAIFPLNALCTCGPVERHPRDAVRRFVLDGLVVAHLSPPEVARVGER